VFPELLPVDAQQERIAGLKAAADLVVNARIDTVIRGGDVEEALVRAAAYRDAGADCVYPIGVADEAAIARFVALGVPVNILLSPDAPPISRLRELGVARVSLGEYVYADAMDFVRERLVSLRGPSA
jgi:2-methylisocitrate lyase-like PEP mutase family enzyme